MPLPKPEGALKCETLSLTAEGEERFILQDIDFRIDPGQALGVIGPSAAGNSSLCKILVGCWKPTRGRATLDGAEIQSWDPAELGQYLGYLPQNVELFTGSVAENIARFAAEAEPHAIIEAARLAGVHEMVLALPEGYNTEIGEGGSLLSGGQRQRIGLARALYGKPSLIVLDEPNAHLDPQGERALVEAIANAKEWGAVMVIVAHHPGILRSTDRIMLLRDGHVEALGERDEILGRFRAALGSAIAAAGVAQPGAKQAS